MRAIVLTPAEKDDFKVRIDNCNIIEPTELKNGLFFIKEELYNEYKHLFPKQPSDKIPKTLGQSDFKVFDV